MKIAVITRTRDRDALLARARSSLCAQTYRPLVWSIVNDGGRPEGAESEAALARAAGIETVLTHLTPGQGRAAAANAGVRACDSDSIILLDDDDELLPDGLRVLAEGLSHAPPGDVGVCARVEVANEAKGRDGTWTVTSRTLANDHRGPVRIVDLAYRNFVPVNGFLYRRSAWLAVGGYDETLPVVEDWDFLLRLILRGDIGRVDATVARYYLRAALASPHDPGSNSVIGGHALHEEHDARLRNRYLRADLAAGRVGLGFLMNPSHRLPMERINAAADGINRAARRNWLLRQLLKAVRR
jgi:glycosyltransferase involved in cell wall biosynthesis